MKKLLLLILAAMGVLGVEAQPTERIYLSGTDVEHPRTWDFYCSGGQNSGAWRTIRVPSCWEQQGYGDYTYGRFYRTKGLKPSTETGRYRTTFKVPKGGHYRLVFEGSMTDTEVWIDGKKVGSPALWMRRPGWPSMTCTSPSGASPTWAWAIPPAPTIPAMPSLWAPPVRR